MIGAGAGSHKGSPYGMIGADAGSHEGRPHGVNASGAAGEQGDMRRCEHGDRIARTFV